MILTDCRLYRNHTIYENMWLFIQNGEIKDFGNMKEKCAYTSQNISVEGRIVVPGFFDQHIHGAVGKDFTDKSEDSIWRILKALPKEGVTSCLATTTTASLEDIHQTLKVIKKVYKLQKEKEPLGAEILGIHLEGPYLSEKAPGVHQKKFLKIPTIDSFKSFQESAGGLIKMVTLAVENDENYNLTRYLNKKGIIASAGHSVATSYQAQEAFKAGCKCVTHCYNAMSGIHHRDIGLAGEALMTKDIKTELICDGVHVHEKAVRLLDKLKSPEDIILITDAMAAKGLSEGTYTICGQRVYSDGTTVKTESGVLAGSVLTMAGALKNYKEMTGRSLEFILPMLSETPAFLHGVSRRKGSIEKGKDADIVILDESGVVHMTFCRGKLVYKNENCSC